MSEDDDEPIYTGAASRLEVLLDLLRADRDTLAFGDGQIQISLTQSVDSLVEEMMYEECVWARLQGYGVTVAPTEAFREKWQPGTEGRPGSAANRTDHRAENVETDFEKPLNVVRTPNNWAQRDSSDLRDDPSGRDVTVIAQFDRAGSDDVLDVFFDANPENTNYHVDWEYGGGLAHGHSFETRQELRGGISALTYMINHYRDAERRR